MILDLFRLDGKVALVTGAAQGLGQGMAIGLAEAGADIVNVGIGDDTETKEKIEALGKKYLGIKANLMTIEPVNPVVKEIVEKMGKIDILLNNAGTIRREDVLKFSEKDWDDVMNLNLKTVFFLSQAVANQYVKQGTGGKIINIASMLSFQGGIRVPSYTASKSGIKGITMLMANELASQSINVNAIAPGYMATANTAPLRADKERSKAILDRIPAGEWGTPKDLAGTAVFLASPASDYINGYTIAVDGGWLAR